MLLFADHRSFSSSEDRLQHCAYCGKDLMVLPNDRRGGACFDCLTLLGNDTATCPECGGEIEPSQRTRGCPHCGWYARRH